MRQLHLVGVTILLAAGCRPAPPPAAEAPDPVERGRYLVTIAACHDCHTPKIFTATGFELDTARFLAGHPQDEQAPPPPPRGVIGPTGWGAVGNNHFTAWYGPWGTSFAANLTPDSTGLSGWTDSLFIVTIRTGKHLGVGRDILPPMPWPVYREMTDDDLKAVFAYLQSLRPVTNRVPPPTPPGSR